MYDDVEVGHSCTRLFHPETTVVNVVFDSQDPSRNTLSTMEFMRGRRMTFVLLTVLWIPLWALGVAARLRMTRYFLRRMDMKRRGAVVSY